MSNRCNYFELGNADGDDLWLEGKIIDGEFIFNGRLFMHDGSQGVVIDSFPKAEVLSGWSQERRMDAEGYRLIDPRGETVFSYFVEGTTCKVDASLYKKSGELAVTAGQDGLVAINIIGKLGKGAYSF
jgi:hypothetical protein